MTRQSAAVATVNEADAIVSGETYSMDYVVGDGSQGMQNNALSTPTKLFPTYAFKAASITFLAGSPTVSSGVQPTINAGIIYIGGEGPSFPLGNNCAISHRHIRLDRIFFKGTVKGDVIHVTFVAE